MADDERAAPEAQQEAPLQQSPPVVSAAATSGVPMEAPMGVMGTVCPHGGFHEFEPQTKDHDFMAGLAAGACSTCMFCIWWPLLLWCARGGASSACPNHRGEGFCGRCARSGALI